MPTQNQQAILRYKTDSGEWVEAKALQSVEFAPGSADCGYRPFAHFGDDAIELCGTFEPIPALRKRLSRKRIRKVLMSFGIPRNIAEANSRDMVQKLDMSFRKIGMMMLVIADLNMEIVKNA